MEAEGNYEEALDLSKQIIDGKPPPFSDEILLRAHKRRIASARMYAAEASCALGRTLDAIKFLLGDGQEEEIDVLASDLSGVALEMAALDGMGKQRLFRAQATVRSTVSTIKATLGNLTVAKQLAVSAQAMEDASTSGHGRSAAKRALAYTLLKSGHQGAALTVLRALR